MNKDKLVQRIMDAYREMYLCTTPKADFDELIKAGVTKQDGWFMKYSITQENFNRILKKATAYLRNNDRKLVAFELNLGCSPTIEIKYVEKYPEKKKNTTSK